LFCVFLVEHTDAALAALDETQNLFVAILQSLAAVALILLFLAFGL